MTTIAVDPNALLRAISSAPDASAITELYNTPIDERVAPEADATVRGMVLRSGTVLSYRGRGGYTKQYGGGGCEKGSTKRNIIRLLVIITLTGGAGIGVAKGAAAFGALNLATMSTCAVGPGVPAIQQAMCTQYASFINWINTELLQGRVPALDYVRHTLTLTGAGTMITTFASRSGGFLSTLIDKIVDFICGIKGFLWEEGASAPTLPAAAVVAAAAAAAAAPAAAGGASAAAGGGGGRAMQVDEQGGGYRKTRRGRKHRRSAHRKSTLSAHRKSRKHRKSRRYH